MATKLNWEYHDASGEYRTDYKDLRLRAVLDSDASNPFEDSDGNWPISVRSPDNFRSNAFKDYEKTGGASIRNVLDRFTDVHLVHWQVHIAKIFDTEISALLERHDERPVKYCRNGAMLRTAFESEMDAVETSDLFDTLVKLYGLLDIPAMAMQSNGYSQGHWCEVLVVATPEAVEQFGCKQVTPEDLQSTIDLYGAWAWGDVYGFIVERVERDEDGDEIEAVELDSCWGFYGTDFDESGMEEAAMSSADYHAKDPPPTGTEVLAELREMAEAI